MAALQGCGPGPRRPKGPPPGPPLRSPLAPYAQAVAGRCCALRVPSCAGAPAPARVRSGAARPPPLRGPGPAFAPSLRSPGPPLGPRPPAPPLGPCAPLSRLRGRSLAPGPLPPHPRRCGLAVRFALALLRVGCGASVAPPGPPPGRPLRGFGGGWLRPGGVGGLAAAFSAPPPGLGSAPAPARAWGVLRPAGRAWPPCRAFVAPASAAPNPSRCASVGPLCRPWGSPLRPPAPPPPLGAPGGVRPVGWLRPPLRGPRFSRPSRGPPSRRARAPRAVPARLTFLKIVNRGPARRRERPFYPARQGQDERTVCSASRCRWCGLDFAGCGNFARRGLTFRARCGILVW